MKFYLLAPLGVVLLLGLAGCSASRDTAWPPPSPLGRNLSTYQPPLDPAADLSAAASRTSQELTLQEALALSLLHNPALQAFGWEVRAREAQTVQAGLWSNPEIEADMEEFGGANSLSGTGAAEVGLGLSQWLPLGGDVGARRQVAARKGSLAGWDYEAARLDILTATTRAFTAVLVAQERLRLADSLLALSQRFAQTVTGRAEAGKVSPLEATRASVVRANAEIARVQAAHALIAARKHLEVSGVIRIRPSSRSWVISTRFNLCPLWKPWLIS